MFDKMSSRNLLLWNRMCFALHGQAVQGFKLVWLGVALVAFLLLAAIWRRAVNAARVMDQNCCMVDVDNFDRTGCFQEVLSACDKF